MNIFNRARGARVIRAAFRLYAGQVGGKRRDRKRRKGKERKESD